MGKLGKKSLSLLIAGGLLLVAGQVNADYYNGTKVPYGGLSVYSYDSSVSTYGYTTHYDYARAQWSGVSSKVSFLSATSNITDKYYVGNASNTDNLGLTTYYSLNGLTSANSDWNSTTVTIYDNSFNVSNFSFANRVATATHEIGHSLKMEHPITASPTDASTSVMRQGQKASFYLSTYDSGQLKAKWGN